MLVTVKSIVVVVPAQIVSLPVVIEIDALGNDNKVITTVLDEAVSQGLLV